jgi:hypothetical protein
MFKLDTVNTLFNCKICGQILDEPICLPCGKTVCRIHAAQIQERCFFCYKNHPIPEDGFPINELVQTQLEIQLNTVSINFSKFNETKKLIQGLNTDFKEIESIRNDPENFISEYFYELNRQVDLRREKLIHEIQQYSHQLIKKISSIHQECIIKSTLKSTMTERIADCSAKLDKLNAMFSTFEMNDAKLDEVMYQRQTKDLQRFMRPIVEDYKFELLGNTSYELAANEFEIGDMFGTLGSSGDYKVRD